MSVGFGSPLVIVYKARSELLYLQKGLKNFIMLKLTKLKALQLNRLVEMRKIGVL